jgi:spore maturation protein CgeB
LRGVALKFNFSGIKGNVSHKPDKPGLEQLLLRNVVVPRWYRHLSGILAREKDFDLVLILNIPLNHLFDVPSRIRKEFNIPVCYFDGDLPASLPDFGGFSSGFSIYDGADIAQYDCIFSNSMGSLDALKGRGARRAEYLWWGADPGVFRPRPEQEDIDLFFYGLGTEYREEWLRDMIAIPSRKLEKLRFVVAGSKLDIDLGRAERIGQIPTSQLSHYASRSKINLNVARRAHASVYASATTRIFELAAMEQCIVSNPLKGIEEWFDVGKEVEVVTSAETACVAYERLLSDDSARNMMAQAARARILSSHTYSHRAVELLNVLESLNYEKTPSSLTS